MLVLVNIILFNQNNKNKSITAASPSTMNPVLPNQKSSIRKRLLAVLAVGCNLEKLFTTPRVRGDFNYPIMGLASGIINVDGLWRPRTRLAPPVDTGWICVLPEQATDRHQEQDVYRMGTVGLLDRGGGWDCGNGSMGSLIQLWKLLKQILVIAWQLPPVHWFTVCLGISKIGKCVIDIKIGLNE